jgi:hypothetical protein
MKNPLGQKGFSWVPQAQSNSDRRRRPSFSKKFCPENFPSFTIPPVKNDPDLSEIGSISQEIYLSAIDLAHLLKVSDAEIAKLARSAVLVRVSHPQDSRAYLYPLLENVTRYVTHLRSTREKRYLGYIREKSWPQKVQRTRAELRHGQQAGKLVEKELVLSKLGESILSFIVTLLVRDERLETTLGRRYKLRRVVLRCPAVFCIHPAQSHDG